MYIFDCSQNIFQSFKYLKNTADEIFVNQGFPPSLFWWEVANYVLEKIH